MNDDSRLDCSDMGKASIGDEAVAERRDAEWQEHFNWLRSGTAPDGRAWDLIVDAGGCESGDCADFTECEVHQRVNYTEELLEEVIELLRAAEHALASYQFGNGAPDLAKSIIEKIMESRIGAASVDGPDHIQANEILGKDGHYKA